MPAAPVELLEAAVRHTLAEKGRGDEEISIALLTDGAIAEMNARWLGREGPTDVLAFTLGDENETVGDVYIGWEQGARQAREEGVSLREELARLAIHGTLHVLGYDHPEGPDRGGSEMFELQERLLSSVLTRVQPG